MLFSVCISYRSVVLNFLFEPGPSSLPPSLRYIHRARRENSWIIKPLVVHLVVWRGRKKVDQMERLVFYNHLSMLFLSPKMSWLWFLKKFCCSSCTPFVFSSSPFISFTEYDLQVGYGRQEKKTAGFWWKFRGDNNVNRRRRRCGFLNHYYFERL